MASVISPLVVPSPRPGASNSLLVRHRFTVGQYHEMVERGIFAEDEPIELIRGEIVRKMPIGNAHAAAVKRLNGLFSTRLRPELLISMQDPISIDDSEPEPDLAILNFCQDSYASRRPNAQDVKLIVEVSESSLAYDREIKGPLYAAAGIGDYWIVNLNNATVEVYRDPQPDGRFATVMTARVGEALAPLTLNAISIQVQEILGL